MGRVNSDQYGTAAIRKLLSAAFSDQEFTTFCYDYFPDVYHNFSVGMSFSTKIQLLIEYCQRRMLIDRLLPLVEAHNPTQYARLGFSHIGSATPAPKKIKTASQSARPSRQLDWNKVAAMVAILALAFAVFVWIFPNLYDFVSPTPTFTPETLTSTFAYQVRVEDNGEAIPNAEVTLQVGDKAPMTSLTDTTGLARILIGTEYNGQPGRLIIDAPGYQIYRREINLVKDDLPTLAPLERK